MDWYVCPLEQKKKTMEDKIKLLKFFTNASELVQAGFFIGLVTLASLVAYFQSYDPKKDSEMTVKSHVFAYFKTFVSGFLAFVFTLLMSASMNWDFFWTCLVGGVSVLFSKQFFEMLYDFMVNRVFGGSKPGGTVKLTDVTFDKKDDAPAP